MKTFVPALALLCIAACSSTDKGSHESHSADAAHMSEQEMMAKQMELGTPGPEHQALASQAGVWEDAMRFRWAPDQPWTEVKGTSTAKPILGGRFLYSDVAFEMMGMPVNGVQILGYDKLTGEHTSMWADSMGTWWTTAAGKAGEDGTIDMRGTMTDVAGTRPFRMVVKSRSENESMTEMYDTIDGKELLVMTIHSKRRL